MPTENRSSTIEQHDHIEGIIDMVSVPREEIEAACARFAKAQIFDFSRRVRAWLDKPAQHIHPEPIAWMVGTAIWWTKEEAERDAAETGLPIVGLGPMTGVAPAEQNQGEPVAWRGLNELGEVVTDWIDGVPPSSMVDLCGNPASFASIEQAYTHADPGEVERLRSVIEQQKNLIASLRAELVESRSIDASAEPTAAIEIDHDALVAAVCVPRSQGLGNLSQAVEVARAALERKPY